MKMEYDNLSSITAPYVFFSALQNKTLWQRIFFFCVFVSIPKNKFIYWPCSRAMNLYCVNECGIGLNIPFIPFVQNPNDKNYTKFSTALNIDKTKTNSFNVNMNFSNAWFYHKKKIRVKEKWKYESTTLSNICNSTNEVRAYCRKAITKQNNTEYFRHIVGHIIVISLFVFSSAFIFFLSCFTHFVLFLVFACYLLTLFTFVNYWWSLWPACMLRLLELGAFLWWSLVLFN